MGGGGLTSTVDVGVPGLVAGPAGAAGGGLADPLAVLAAEHAGRFGLLAGRRHSVLHAHASSLRHQRRNEKKGFQSANLWKDALRTAAALSTVWFKVKKNFFFFCFYLETQLAPTSCASDVRLQLKHTVGQDVKQSKGAILILV